MKNEAEVKQKKRTKPIGFARFFIYNFSLVSFLLICLVTSKK